MHAYASLSFRSTVELLRTLGNGHVGFDYKKHALADLRRFIAAWIDQGAFTLQHVEAIAQSLLTPPAPAPTAVPPAPTLQSIPSFVPAPPAPVIVPAPVVPAAPIVVAPIAPAPVAPAPVAPAPVAPAPVAPAPVVVTQPCGAVTTVLARSLFADQPDVAAALPADLHVRHYGSADAPEIDPSYHFEPLHVVMAMSAFACTPPMPIWLAGPRGSGKTEFIRQIAARLGRAYFRVNFTRATEPAEVLGDVGLADGATLWQDGPVTTALRTPGAVLLLDEPTYAAPGHLAALNPILEAGGGHVRLPRCGGLLTPAADVCIAAADNTLGFGDTSGEYAGRQVIGADTLDRFRFKLTFAYLAPDVERAVLTARVHDACGRRLTKTTAGMITKLLAVARETSSAGDLVGAPSLRGAVAFAVALAQGLPVIVAYECAIVNAAPIESAEKLRQIFAAHWSDSEIALFEGNR